MRETLLLHGAGLDAVADFGLLVRGPRRLRFEFGAARGFWRQWRGHPVWRGRDSFAFGGSGGTSGSASSLGLTPCRDLSANASFVAAAAASPYLLLVSELGASVYALSERRVLRTFTGQFGAITAGALSPDGSWGATIGGDRVLRFWHASSGQEFAHAELAQQPKALAPSPPGSSAAVAVVEDGGGVRVVDAHDGHSLWSKVLPDDAPSAVLFTPDGTTLLLTTSSGLLRLRVKDGAQQAPLSWPDAGPAALSADGSLLAVAGKTSARIDVLNPADGSVRNSITPRSTVTALTFTRDASELVLGTAFGLLVYDANTGLLVRTLLNDSAPVTSVASSADGASVLSGGHRTHLYRLSDGSELETFGQTGFVWGGSFAGDGRLLFSGAEGPNQVWDATQGTRLGLIERSTASGNQGAVLFAPSGLVLVNFERTATFWDVPTAQVVRSFDYDDATETRAGFNLMTFSPDGATLIGEGSPPTQGQIRFWDAANGKLLRTLPGHGASLNALSLAPAGDVLASAGFEAVNADGTVALGSAAIKLWDLGTSTLLHTLQGHTVGISSLAFSPDGTRLLSSDAHGLVRLWSVADGAVVRDLATDISNAATLVSNYGFSAAFSPDGQLVASAGVDWSITDGHTGSIALWSAADGAVRGHLLSLNEANLGSIQWSPDGKLLAAGTSAGMRVWCLDELPAAPESPLH